MTGLGILSIGPIVRVSRGVDGHWYVFAACLAGLVCLAALAAITLMMQTAKRRAEGTGLDVWPGFAPLELQRALAGLGRPLPPRSVGSAEHMVSLRADDDGVSWWHDDDDEPVAFVPWEDVAEVYSGTGPTGGRGVVVALRDGVQLPTRLTGFALFAMSRLQMAEAAEKIDRRRRQAQSGLPDNRL
jgi:hypothetical protein